MRVFPIVPKLVDDLVGNARNFSLPTSTYWCARHFLLNAQRVVVAAAICFAAYKGSMITAGALATVSIPATTLAAGAMAIKYGFTALKAGIAAKQLSQAALGVAALYAGWQLFDNYQIFATKNMSGFLDSEGTYSMWNLSKTIADKLGYKTEED